MYHWGVCAPSISVTIVFFSRIKTQDHFSHALKKGTFVRPLNPIKADKCRDAECCHAAWLQDVEKCAPVFFVILQCNETGIEANFVFASPNSPYKSCLSELC